MVLKIQGDYLQKKLQSNVHTSSKAQADDSADFVSDFIKNVLSENEVRLNELGTLHISRLHMY